MKTKYILLLSSLFISSSFAANVTSNFQSTATLERTCTVSSADLNFGSVTPAETGDATTTGNINLTCTRSTSVQLKVGLGSAPESSFSSRKMSGATSGNTSVVAYNIYTDSSYSTILGDGASEGSGVIDIVGTGASQNINIYGKLPLNQYISPDSYSDTLTATLVY